MDRLIHGAKRLGLALSPEQIEKFELFYRQLTDWNRRVNLTAITGYEEVQTKHFLDSLTAVLALKSSPGLSLIDIGTGAGMPGVPLKILFPETKLVLLDSVAKKTTFLRQLLPSLRLDGVEVLTGRAEEVAHLPAYREQFDGVLSRAVAPLAEVVELGLPFARQGGLLIAYKKGDIAEEVRQAGRAIDLLGGKLRGLERVDLEELGDGRIIVVIEKVAPTPPQYPRRPGLPQKRPLR